MPGGHKALSGRRFAEKFGSSQLEKQYSADALTAMVNDKGDAMAINLGASEAVIQAFHINHPEAAAYIRRGRGFLSRGYYDQAIADFNQALQLNPSTVAAYVNRGQIYNLEGAYDQAIADFNRTIQLDASRPIPYLNRGV